MSDEDVLGSERRPKPRRLGSGRRLVGVAVAVLVSAGAVVLAFRSGPDRPTERATVTSTPTPAAAGSASADLLWDVAVHAGRVHLLTRACKAGSCARLVLTWDSGRWITTTVGVLASDASRVGQLLVTGNGRYLAVVGTEGLGAYVSADGGRSFAARSGRLGPPVDALPDGLAPVVDSRISPGIIFFDPVGGGWRPLRHQPPDGPYDVLAGDGVLHAVSRRGAAVVVATSRTAGRDWQVTTATRLAFDPQSIRLVATGSTISMVVIRPNAEGGSELAAVLRSGANWTPVLDRSGQQSGRSKRSVEVVSTADGGLLATDGETGGTRILATGHSFTLEAPRGAVGEPALVPAVLRAGTDGTVAALTSDLRHVLLRGPNDTTWHVLRLPS